MITWYIGIWRRGKMFQSYYREGNGGLWKQNLLNAEEKTIWSDQSFHEIFRRLQINESATPLGIIVISDKEKSIDFPKVSNVVHLSYEDIRDFCLKYAEKGAAHWILNGKPLDDTLCQKAGFPIDVAESSQYIFTNGKPIGSLDAVTISESEIPPQENKVEEERSIPSEDLKPLTKKQRSHNALFREIRNGSRENPLKKWKTK